MADYSMAYNPYAGDAYGGAYKGAGTTGTSGTGLDKKLNMLLFGAACIVVLSGALALVSFLLEPWAVFDIMNEVFLVVFGAVLFVLHAPLNFKWIMDYKAGISKYCRLLTRFTGLGMYLLFLGCLLFNCLWNEDVSYLFAVLFTLYVCGLGVFALFFGSVKTLKLDRVRREVLAKVAVGNGGNGADKEAVLAFASGFTSEHRGSALTKGDFQDMCASLPSKITFINSDLALVFKSIGAEQASDTPNHELILLEDFCEWCQPGALPMLL